MTPPAAGGGRDGEPYVAEGLAVTSRVVGVTLTDSEVTIQTASYDGLNRRAKKVVSNSGNLDGTTVFYYNDRWQVLETRDGSGNLVMQVYPGTQYVDEVVGLRLKDRGRVYVHQAEGDQGGSLKDWNVTDLTDLTGRVLERYYYSPYGELVHGPRGPLQRQRRCGSIPFLG